MSYDHYLLDAMQTVMEEDYCNELDDAALASAIVSMANYLAHAAQD